MRIVVFTSNALRHKFVANGLAEAAGETLVVSEVKPAEVPPTGPATEIEKHFALRMETEASFFAGHETFRAPTLPLRYKEANLPFVRDLIARYRPDMGFVFGSSIIREPLLSLIPRGRFVNLHLGLSPYYRGSGTNFWPFVNRELEYVGSTLLHIDAGIDTGDIIAHVRPSLEAGDTVHTAGSKVIAASVPVMAELIRRVERGEELPRVPQWTSEPARFYKVGDFTEGALARYYDALREGVVAEHLANPRVPKLVALS